MIMGIVLGIVIIGFLVLLALSLCKAASNRDKYLEEDIYH